MPRFQFCPWCGSRFDEQTEHDREDGGFACSGCGRVLYVNSKPCAGALVERDGKVLLIRRAIEPFRDAWDIPGGFLQPGEHPSDGAIREIREETGLVVELRTLLGIWMDTYASGDTQADTLNCYYVAVPVGGRPRPSDDAAEVAWFGPDELPERIAFEHAPAVLAAWREHVTGRSE